MLSKKNGETNIFCDGMEKFKGCSFVYSDTGADSIFRKGMQLLKPSKEMQDWEKFSWKRGDVLISDCGFVCIFKEWASDDYTKFNGCYFDGMPNAETAKYCFNSPYYKTVPFTHVLFINGYREDSPRIEKEIESITIGKPKKGLCPDKWLDTEFFIIKFK